MATLPFRPPQFSDDAAWLPPWLQPTHSQSSPTPLHFPLSLQDADLHKGGDNHAKTLLSEGIVQKSNNVFNLYLSGEDTSPMTLTPCEKVVHFNLYLSTDEPSSIHDTFQSDSINPADVKAVHSVEEPRSPINNSSCNWEKNKSVINLFPSKENCSGKVCKKNSCKTRNSEPDNSENNNAKGAGCDDINEAVELSVAASEALVIHEIIRTESILEAMSSAAVLEVALRVKQARIDGLQDSLYCLRDNDSTSETLSDLSDSDLNDVYKDVGFSISRLDYISSTDPSVSRVKDTPVTHIHPDEEGEIQSEWDQDMEFFKNRFFMQPKENNLDTDKSKDLPSVTFSTEQHEKLVKNANFDLTPEAPSHLGLETLDNTQMNQGENNNKIDDSHLAHQNLTASLQLLHSGRTDMKKGDGGSSCGYQSRWLGGWGAKEGGDCGGKESNKPKPISKMLINEASYLSESTYVAPDQNSVVNHHQSCSEFSEAKKSLEDSCQIATREALVSQDVVKYSNSSLVDSLCSMVPCSIASEINKASMTTKSIDDPRGITGVKSFSIVPGIFSETVHTSSGQNDENIEREENTKLILGDVCIDRINRIQNKSLKDYSRGSLEKSPASLEEKINNGLEKGEGNELLLHGTNNFVNREDLLRPVFIESLPGCSSAEIKQHDDTRQLTVDQHASCHNTLTEKDSEKQRSDRSMAECTTSTNSENQHLLNSAGNPVEHHCEGSDKNQAQVHTHMRELRKSSLVLNHKTRRLRAPDIPVNDLPTGIQADDQGPENIHHKRREVRQSELRGLSNIEKSRKRVRFSDADIKPCSNKRLKKNSSYKTGSAKKVINMLEHIDEEQGITSQEVKERLTNCCLNGRKKSVFQGLDFLLTGFSKKKEQEIEAILRKQGGIILSDFPTPLPRSRERTSRKTNGERLPVVVCSRKLQTTTFLYGCAVNAFLLKAGWVYDSIKAGSVLPPDKYEVLSNRTERMLNHIGKSISQNDVDYIFVKVGIMLHGTHSFCTRFSKCIKHGRGLVYKSLQWLVQSLDKKKISLGAIVVEEDNQATRHLKKYASEQKIPVMPASWIVNSLFEGKLLPVPDNISPRQPPVIEVPRASSLQEQDWSQEI